MARKVRFIVATSTARIGFEYRVVVLDNGSDIAEVSWEEEILPPAYNPRVTSELDEQVKF
jgi:hypothetical protein